MLALRSMERHFTSLLNIPVTLKVTVLKVILDWSVTKTKENQAGAGKV